MSTATQTRQTQTTYAKPPEGDILDRVIAATEDRTKSTQEAAAKFLGCRPDRIYDLLRQFWRPSKDQPEFSNGEIWLGMSMIARYGLDPATKEIYLIRTRRGLAIIIGIDGYIKILHRTDDYDGFEQQERFSEDGKRMLSVTTTIYSKSGRRPTVYNGYAEEYARVAGDVAEKMPWHMLRIFSLRHAVRLFTPIGGNVVTEDEAQWMERYDRTPTPSSTAADQFAADLKAAKTPKPEAAPEPEESQETEQGMPDVFDGKLLDSEPAAQEGPGPEAMYLDALDSADEQQIKGILQQARQEGQAGRLTSKALADIEARAKRRARELKGK